MKRRPFFLTFFLIISIGLSYGADISSVLEQANNRLDANDWAGAQRVLSQAAASNPESADTIAETYSDFGLIEYNRRNFKNAYAAFREALKLQPTNQTATQYYLKIRREMDAASLRNEYVPPAASAAPVVEPVTAVPPVETGVQTPLAVVPIVEAPPVQSQADREEDLKILIDQLKVAEARLNRVEGTADVKQAENDVLRQQLESQRQQVERMLAAQRSAAAPAARPTTVENASLNETIRLLTQIVERDQNRPPVVVQSDPALERLEEQMTAALESLGGMSVLDYILIAAIVLMGAGFFVLAVFMIAAASRRRKRGTGSFETNPGTTGVPYFPGAGGSNAITGSGRGQAPLLDFVDPGTMEGESRELVIHRHLLKAEKLNRMYEEVRSGALSWNTVRKYVGELEVSLRAEILKTVERKLEEGDLLENQSILPVLFPFLTDYDDYVREKAEKLAQRALKNGAEESAADGTDPDFLSLQNLMEIPRKLHVIFRNQEQTLVTAKICRGMGSVLGLSADDRNLLYKSALAHDCGYLMLNQDKLSRIIVNKEISVEDFKFIQSHAVSGSSYFKKIDLPEQMRGAILSHHERNDGSGYPDGLRDEEIPLFAKIIGVAETFSALVSRRSYRDKLDMTHALAIVADGTRLKFDPSHVEALKEVVPSMGAF